MKFVILLAALIATLPLATWLRNNPRHTVKVWTLMGFLPFIFTVGPHPLYIAIISWPGWPGYVKGAEFSAIDVLAIAIYLSQPRKHHPTPFLFSMGLYFLGVVASALPAQVPMAALFYVWQLARMFLVYVIVARACSDERVVQALLTGMAIGICLEVVVAGWQRLGRGVIQAGGTFGEKNVLGLVSQFVGAPWFALWLAGRRGRLPYLAPLGCAITSVLTVSRAALGLNAFGLFTVFILSAMRKWTAKKARIALFSGIALVVLLPVALVSLQSRFASDPSEGGYDERAAFERAAMQMLYDHPFGVGANNYVVVANTGGYNAQAGVATTFGSLSTNVHNAYLLVASETGYFGLLTFVIFLLHPLTVAFRCGWRNRRDQRGDLLLGLGVALLTIYLHCFYEWIFLTFLPQYLFAMTLGLVAGVAQQLGYWGRTRASGLGIKSAAIAQRR